MGSVQAWRFTQRLAGIVLGALGLILTVTMVIISTGFPGMEVMDMVWKTCRCLLWQAGLSAFSMVAINLTAFFLFDRKGFVRTTPKEEKQ